MSKTIEVALTGVGWMGSTLLKRIAEQPNAHVHTVMDTNTDRVKALLGELNLDNTNVAHASQYDQVILNDEIDAVFLVTPNAFHGPQSIAAMRAGKHVFCEKPSATTFADHCKQVDLERSMPGIKTYVDYLLNFDTFEQRLRKMIADDTFGKVTQFQINYRHPINIAGNKTWKLDRSIMGDAIGMGINHAISVMVLAMAAQARPLSVFATSMPAQVRPFEADPIWNIQIRFDNDATGFVFGNIDTSNGYDAYHSVSGTKGALIFDSLLDREQKIRMWSESIADGQWFYPLDQARCEKQNITPWPSDTTTPDSGDVAEHQTGQCVKHFFDCIRNDHASHLSFANSGIIAEIGWAAQTSAILNRPVDLPLDRELVSQTLQAKEPVTC
jgi:predicted dehydrogenase